MPLFSAMSLPASVTVSVQQWSFFDCPVVLWVSIPHIILLQTARRAPLICGSVQLPPVHVCCALFALCLHVLSPKQPILYVTLKYGPLWFALLCLQYDVGVMCPCLSSFLCCMKATFQSPLASPQMHLCHSSIPFTRRPHWTNVAPYEMCGMSVSL